ncbi:MAG: hypothetical protein ACFKPT_14870 [Gloeotrichia echinulata GP01]
MIKDIDLEFLSNDLAKILSSMKVGSERIREIVLTLRNFSRLDEAWGNYAIRLKTQILLWATIDPASTCDFLCLLPLKSHPIPEN